MGRFSPTVLPVAAGGIGQGLLEAADAFTAQRDKKRAQGRQDVADSREAARFADELRNSELQRTATQQNIELGGVNLQTARDNAAVAPLEREARLRSEGYTPDGQGGYSFNQDFAPVSPAEQFRRSLDAEARGNAFRHGENVYTQTQENARNASSGATQRAVADIYANSRENVANITHSLSGGTSLGQLSKMNPEARRRHFGNVAQTALQAAEAQLPAGDTVVLGGKQYTRADARRQLAAQAIVDDPDTKDYFSYGMSTSDLDASNQKFGERPAARADAKDARKAALMRSVLGDDAPPANAPAANGPANAPPGALSPNEKMQAKNNPAFAAWLKKKGHNESEWK